MVKEDKAKDQTPINPHARRLEELERQRRIEEDPKKFQIEEDMRIWEEEQAAKKAKEEMQNDPQRIAALKHAKTTLFESKFNPQIGAQAVDTMRRLITYIEQGGDLQKAHSIEHAVGEQVVKDMNVKMQQTLTV